MVKYTDVMIDVESLGNEGKFIVTSIALVPFNIHNDEIGEPLVLNISLAESINAGFKANPRTLEWWTEQNTEAFKGMFTNSTDLSTAIYNIAKLFSMNNFERCWATAVLDYQAISNISDYCEVLNPIVYSKRMCARTIRMLHDAKFEPIEIEYTHDAVDDCMQQINALKLQLSRLGLLDCKYE